MDSRYFLCDPTTSRIFQQHSAVSALTLVAARMDVIASSDDPNDIGRDGYRDLRVEGFGLLVLCALFYHLLRRITSRLFLILLLLLKLE
jgi:hypothetical protein